MSVLAIVPARAGSKRIPGKNMRALGGKPLAAWAIEAGLAARSVDRLVVSSDDPAVLELAASYHADLPLQRPVGFAGDDSPAIDYVRHALEVVESAGDGPFDVVVILQPSSPFTAPADIDATVQLLLDTGADSAVTVVQVDHMFHPLKFKVMQGDRLSPFVEEERGRMAAHELPAVFVRNCAVYATRRGAIDRGEILGDDSRGYVMPRERSIDINDPLDLAFAAFLLEQAAAKRAPHA